jgi:copper chaperone CopZ
MKRTLTLLVALFLFVGFSIAKSNDDKVVKVKTSAICDMCKERLEKNVGLSKGVKEATLDLDTKVMTVTYNAKKTDAEAIKAVITKTGYDADGQEADQKAHDKLPKCCRKTATPH